MRKLFVVYIIALFILIALFSGMFYAGTILGKVGVDENGVLVEGDTLNISINENDHIRGERDAKVSIIEYSDLECPYCKTFHSTAQLAVKQYPGDVNWVFRHFPLSSHAGAFNKAVASECAADQSGNSAFWLFVDSVFDADALAVTELPVFAEGLGMDKAEFEACMESGKFSDKVASMYQSAIDAGITGTPGIVILHNETGKTQLVKGALPLPELKQVLNTFLNKN